VSAAQNTTAVTQIAPHVVDQRRPDLVARRFPYQCGAAELEPRVAARFVGAHAGAAVLFGLLIDVKADLLVEAPLERIAPDGRLEPAPAVYQEFHWTLNWSMWRRARG
jgi:hypothetical protein